MKVAVFGTKVSSEFSSVLQEFFRFFEKNRIGLQLFYPFKEFIQKDLHLDAYHTSVFSSHIDFDPDCKFIFSVGGDGTFLHSVMHIRNFDIPVVGVNSGRLGFLADISENQINGALSRIFEGEFSVIERSMLQVDFCGQENLDFNFALNEMTVLKTDTSSMINISAYLGDDLLNNYWADGLIIATPTGSTAYSLSVGGPILTPDSANFVITPLAPHNLTVRPLVVPDNYEIKLKVEGRGSHFLTSLDFRSVPVELATEIKVKKADFKVKTLQLNDQTFFSTLRSKLMWGIDRRN